MKTPTFTLVAFKIEPDGTKKIWATHTRRGKRATGQKFDSMIQSASRLGGDVEVLDSSGNPAQNWY